MLYDILLYKLILLRGYQFPCKFFIADNFLSPNQFIPLFYIFSYLLLLGLKVCLPLHKKVGERKEDKNLIHLDTGIECNLSTRQEKQMV